MGEMQVIEKLKAGQIIIVRAKNGHGWPSLRSKPEAYRCKIGERNVSGKVVMSLLKRRIIEPVSWGWYSVGHFRFNSNLRDARGRFRRRAPAPTPAKP